MKMEAINFNVKKIFSLMGHYSIKIFTMLSVHHHITFTRMIIISMLSDLIVRII